MDSKLRAEMISNIAKHYTDNKPKKVLKMDKRLPIIILPDNKLKMFQDWWNSDIRFENSVPKSFESGYLLIENINRNVDYTDSKFAPLISTIAKYFNATYRQIENQFKDFIEKSKNLTIYFKFLDTNKIYAETYGSDNEILSKMSFEIGNSDAEKEINLFTANTNIKSFDDMMNEMNYQNLALLITILWYIATSTRSTKYIYENKTPVVVGRKKNVVQVSDTKYITTPIYDFNKVKIVKTESLQSRKSGWTYSHSFQVHGHYRHYKNGKTIFIQPFIKGQNKEFKSQTIIIEPK